MDGFIAKSLHYNPRAFEKFKEIFEFRWSVAEEELGAQHKKPNPKMTAAQAIIEIRWPQWNWVAYRFPDAEQEFKKLMKTLAKKSGGLNFNKRAEKLRKRFPQLEPFLKDVSLCEFYKEYYTLLEKK